MLTRLRMAGALLNCCVWLGFAQEDPPSRVARLNYVSGNVSMKPAESNDWLAAEVNRPFSSGDYLYTDMDGRAELHVDVAAIRMGPRTSFGFSALTDQAMQIKLSDGDMYFRVHNLGPSESIEVDTPNATVSLLRDGSYRFRVDSAGGISFVVVRQGTAEVNGGGQGITVNPGNSLLLSGVERPTYDLEQAPKEDEFDSWCSQRDYHEAHLAATHYVPPTLIGYEDLDDNGSWDAASQYGPVWYPRAVPTGWAPYRYGHWVWIAPWGWTWVDEERWGFAPFHYGRWVYVNERWGWCPGPIMVVQHGYAPPIRPHYAPALVAWVGGAHWGVSVSVGGPPLGWVALGIGELYTPPYHCSPHYFNNVNVNNTRVVNKVNITNVYKTVYVNKTVYNQTYVHMNSPNAVVAMQHSAFVSGQPVRQQAMVLKRDDIQQMQTAMPPPRARGEETAHLGRAVPAPPPPAAVRLTERSQSVPAVRPPAAFTERSQQAPPPVRPADRPAVFTQRTQQQAPPLPAPVITERSQQPPTVKPPDRPAAFTQRTQQPAPPPPARPAMHEYPPHIAERSQTPPPRPAEHHDAPKHEEHKEHRADK